MRRRLGALFIALNIHFIAGMMAHIEGETGEKVPIEGGPHWRLFFRDCPLDTLLDVPALAMAKLRALGEDRTAEKWREEVERVLREEQMAYFSDDECGLHLRVDEAFQRTRKIAVEAIKSARYSSASSFLRQAFEVLDSARPDPRTAIRSAFEAVESIYKLLAPNETRLAGGANKALKPVIARVHAQSGNAARQAAQHALTSFCAWVSACQFYRHAPASSEPAEPPGDLWRLLMSQAAAYVRWLAELDKIVSSGGENGSVA